jgi:Ca2+-transporting ATPase
MTESATLRLDNHAWAREPEEVLEGLAVEPLQGLDANEVIRRQDVFGHNELAAPSKRPIWSILVAQFRGVVTLLLVAATVLAFLFSDFAEGIAIIVVIVINSSIGFITELRAVRSMENLRQLVRIDCVVVRDGVIGSVAAAELVPGDIVLFEAGDLVPADIRVIEAAKLEADESTLTGESLPVRKTRDALARETPLLDRNNIVFSGTSITRGSGRGVVVGTGAETEFGRIFHHVATAKAKQTPLEERLDALGVWLAWIVIGIAVLLAIVGIAKGREIILAVEVAIALSVAAVPEGLAIVATIALARGMWRLAKRNALITRLSAVETLGAVSVILTDKTGTLTENRMAVTTILLDNCDVDVAGGEAPGDATFFCDEHTIAAPHADTLDDLLRAATFCSNASLQVTEDGQTVAVGDPTELALLVAASGRGIWRHALLADSPEVHEEPFDPDDKRMATVHEQPAGVLVAVKGAPETLIPGCVAVRQEAGDGRLDTEQSQRWLARAERLARKGLRTIAVAEKTAGTPADPFADLTLLGVFGLEDPAREGVDHAIHLCQEAGINVVMVTGDHAATARNIATTIGAVQEGAAPQTFVSGDNLDQLLDENRDDDILRARVFSRVSPEQKLKLISRFQDRGHIVAMTGDGVNDAPALKKADIGVAMGIRGTAVAKEAAAMVLQDDDLNTIVVAVAHGRAIFQNIRKFVVYLLSCNVSEVLIVSLATLSGAPLPLLPLQILFLNLVTDVFPALALGVGEGSPILMQRRPRPATEPILTRALWFGIGLHGFLMACVVLSAMAISVFGLGYAMPQAVTVTFCTLAFAQMWHVFNMRDDMKRVFTNEIVKNYWIWGALLLCLVLVLAAVYVPLLRDVLALTAPDWRGWALIVMASLVPLLTGPVVRLVTDRDRPGVGSSVRN